MVVLCCCAFFRGDLNVARCQFGFFAEKGPLKGGESQQWEGGFGGLLGEEVELEA